MEHEAKFDPIEVIIQRLVEGAAIIAPVFQAQYTAVKEDLGDAASKASRTMYSRMTYYGKRT